LKFCCFAFIITNKYFVILQKIQNGTGFNSYNIIWKIKNDSNHDFYFFCKISRKNCTNYFLLKPHSRLLTFTQNYCIVHQVRITASKHKKESRRKKLFHIRFFTHFYWIISSPNFSSCKRIPKRKRNKK
jgi:hypothetical protein